jgi:hypothetical protein
MRITRHLPSCRNLLSGVLGLALTAGLVADARAQSSGSYVYGIPGAPAVRVSHRPRIEINPRPLLYRRCVDWYELQNRPSGTVLFPQMHCWWVRG